MTNPPVAESNIRSNLYLIKPTGEKVLLDNELRFGGGLTISADQTQLYVADHRTHFMYVWQIQSDGTLKHKQQYGWLHVADTADTSGAYGMHMDRDGRIYIATAIGIQVLDQLGRVNAIIPAPTTLGRVWSVALGGENFDTLYIAAGDKVFSRKLKVKGAPSWSEPSKPMPSRL
jgi:sugar lactone lactonase YvrE